VALSTAKNALWLVHLAAQSFASATGMALPPGDALVTASSALEQSFGRALNTRLWMNCPIRS
jgi:hypothetical protein